jgi:hypothetical protein
MGISRVLDNNMQKKPGEFVLFWLLHISFSQEIVLDSPSFRCRLHSTGTAAAAAAAAAAFHFTLLSID